jgi:hypothetical protein
MTAHLESAADGLLQDLLGEVPAVLVLGARAGGKTATTTSSSGTVVRLDRDADAAAFRADPDVAVRGLQEPVLLDEFGAVKRRVDEDQRPDASSSRAPSGPTARPRRGRGPGVLFGS